MSQTEAEALVLAVLHDIQAKCGLEETPPDKHICPLIDLPGFDSLLALEACVELESQIGMSTEENHFVGENNAPRTVEQIAASLRAAMEEATVEQQ